MVDFKTPKGHFEINWPLVSILPNKNNMYCIFPVRAKNIVWPYWKVLQIWVGKQKMLLSWHFYLQFTKKTVVVSTSENLITLRNLDFFTAPGSKPQRRSGGPCFFDTNSFGQSHEKRWTGQRAFFATYQANNRSPWT